MNTQQVYETLIKNLPIGFSIVDKDGVIIDFNQSAEKITGYLKKEVMGKSHIEILHGSSDGKAYPLFKVLSEEKEAVAAETLIKRKDVVSVFLSVTTAPLFDDEGNIIGGLELFRDITELKRMQRERNNMFSMFAHDMKNSVTTAGGFLLRLLSGKAGGLIEKQRNYLEIMRDELDKLLDIITDFLEFSRFEAKICKPVVGPSNIETAIYKNIEAVKIEADAKGIHLFFESPEMMPPVIDADGMMIDRVIRNLFVNAIKYSNPGGKITVMLLDRDNDILVRVSDAGVGIPEEQLPYIFDAFYRVSRDSKGSGLGLAIAKTIVEAHGGWIWAESSSGKGSVFSFTLPKQQGERTSL